MTDKWSKQTKALWAAINENCRFSEFGGLASVRSTLAMCRLSPSTWGTYASSMTKFVQYLTRYSTPISEVTERTLEAFVCWIATQPTLLRGSTVASTISGIRSCLAEFGNVLDPSAGTAAALQGYKRLAKSVHTPLVQYEAWNPEWTLSALQAVRHLLYNYIAGQPMLPVDYNLLVATMHVTCAQLTFARGATTSALTLADVAVSWNETTRRFTITFGLLKQKRAPHRLPLQTHVEEAASEGPMTEPRHCLCQFFEAQKQQGGTPTTLAFTYANGKTMTLDASVKILVDKFDIHHWQGARLTGHTVRVGAATAAVGIGVPLTTVAHMMVHKDLKSTRGYIRHGTPTTHAATVFYGHLCPSFPGQQHSARH